MPLTVRRADALLDGLPSVPTVSAIAPTAILLAAGLGSRLRAVIGDRPKGFVEVGGEALIVRSLERLGAAGVRDMVLVAGWRADHYRDLLATRFPSVRLALNPAYATTGSLASLLIGARDVTGDVLVVESDLLYEPRALTSLLGAPSPDTLLASGPTGGGDEVWVYGRDARLGFLSKQARPDLPRLGELVGLTRLSAGTLARLRAVEPALSAGAHYEDGLNAVGAERPVAVLTIADLIWCEVDDPAHLARARGLVWPRIAALESVRR